SFLCRRIDADCPSLPSILMPIVALLAAAAGLVWGAVYARRGSLIAGCVALVIVGYALGHTFWHAKIGPLTLTLDRVLLVALFGAYLVQWRTHRLEPKPLAGCDWLLFTLLGILAASTLASGTPEVVAPDGGSPMWRLTMSFLVPAALYWIARQAPLSQSAWKGWLAGMTLLGAYLGLTACAEITHQWWLVFPHYISDPTLGIHFGRARGPDLNSASLGVYLTACLWSAWFLRPYVRPSLQLIVLATLSVMALGVFLTYTRSTWIGLISSGAIVAAMQVPRRLRLPVFTMGGLVGAAILATTWTNVVDLEREGTGLEAHHSIDQRESFAYVSWKMFSDNPLFGVGFGRFYDRKLPYLSDRSQNFELESIRPLHHHNTLLSVLTETGIVGFAAFVSLLAGWARVAWCLARDRQAPAWARGQGVLMLAIMANYLSSAVFHDLTLLPQQEWLLFLFAGLTLNLRLGSRTDPQLLAEKGTFEYLAPSLLSAPTAGTVTA
ncbi:MAG TPA: O-antigen ligase family protein, partial [Pirellulales bacterium]